MTGVKYLLSRHKMAITNIRKGTRSSPKIIRIGDSLKIKVRCNQGTTTGHGAGLGSHYSGPTFAYTIIAEGEQRQKTELNMQSKSSVGRLLEVFETTIPLERLVS